jgi:hypothetical protein
VNDPVVSHGINSHGLLREAKEELAPTLGSPAIEAERELIQIVVEVLVADRSLVGSNTTVKASSSQRTTSSMALTTSR